jgi:hypothetical protein
MDLNVVLNQIRKVLPNASIGEDNDGQIVIYTDCRTLDGDTIVPFDDTANEEAR